jgi:predicted metal-binding protein
MPKYVVAVQCDIVKDRCSGYMCQREFRERSGPFAAYAGDESVQFVSMTCGGCCGKATHRKLRHLLRQAKKNDRVEPSDVTVHLASCVCKSNFHGPACPHVDYLRTLIADSIGLQLVDGTVINALSEKRRQDGTYPC